LSLYAWVKLADVTMLTVTWDLVNLMICLYVIIMLWMFNFLHVTDIVDKVLISCVSAEYVQSNTDGVCWQRFRFWATHCIVWSLGKWKYSLFLYHYTSFTSVLFGFAYDKWKTSLWWIFCLLVTLVRRFWAGGALYDIGPFFCYRLQSKRCTVHLM